MKLLVVVLSVAAAVPWMRVAGQCADGQYECAYGSCIPDSWVCDGFADCPIDVDDELGCNTNVTTTAPPPVANISCREGFDPVDGRCVMLDIINELSWAESRYFCGLLSADLLVIDDMNFFRDFVRFINDLGLTGRSYWVGGSDAATEGSWGWVSGESMARGTPLWAIKQQTTPEDYVQEPRDTTAAHDCAYMDHHRYFYLADEVCNVTINCVCQTPTWDASQAQHGFNCTVEEALREAAWMREVAVQRAAGKAVVRTHHGPRLLHQGLDHHAAQSGGARRGHQGGAR